jgi:uracil phosphoribosyltransferase
MPAPVHVSSHPIIQHKLARLRATDTKPPEFRDLVAAISRALFFDATQDVKLKAVTITTPLTITACQEIAEKVGLVPVLRAGLGMADAMLEALPEASVWHLGLYRDHATLKPVTYYNKLPAKPDMDVAIVLDPMLATGGTTVAAHRHPEEGRHAAYQVRRADRGTGRCRGAAVGPSRGADLPRRARLAPERSRVYRPRSG